MRPRRRLGIQAVRLMDRLDRPDCPLPIDMRREYAGANASTFQAFDASTFEKPCREDI